MPQVLLQCKSCKRIFPSGINLGVGATATLKGNISQCPFCKSMESIPDGTFKGTVEGIIKVLDESDNPIGEAEELLEALKKSKTPEDFKKIKESPRFSKYKKWIPDSPKKLSYYAIIVATLIAIIKLLLENPEQHIEYNQHFINVYNSCVIVKNSK